jgi:exopolysaccharide biosynthesis polyprenyl glycosylphosphotransferase
MASSVVGKLTVAVTEPTRQTDIKGWYKQGTVIGVIFTEVGPANDKSAVEALSNKITISLRDKLTADELRLIRITFHLFPEDWGTGDPEGPTRSVLQMDLAGGANGHKAAVAAKRFIDIAGSVAGLILFIPLMAAIAIAIKLSSKGPVLFRQVRFGQYGKKFTFLKFRSMYVDSDHRLHEEYVARFIKGLPEAELSAGKSEKLYKLTDDPRITPIGRLLRKTSLDELPQFLNVIRGEMSLVGPRPPVMYEVERYDLWHRQRLLAVKPGITGLWQVEGRSRVKFDEMVRLDIRYARSWSIWLDIKILLQTPRAVILGSGAH